MAGVNKVILIGNLGADPEVKYLPSGDTVAALRIATSEKWKDKAGEQKEHIEWHRVTAFGKLAQIMGEYLRKGSPVYIEGSLRTRSYDKNGQKHYSTEVRADQMQMLGNRGSGGDGIVPPRSDAPTPPPKPAPGGYDAGFDDDIPF